MMLERVHSFISSLRSRRTSRGQMRVSLQETGFQLHSTDQREHSPTCLKWQEITTVLAYKRDCFAIDLVCLAIADSVTVLEINEQDAGWEEFIRAVENNLPGSVPLATWWPAVAQPPFAPNQTTVYRKEQPSGNRLSS
jgi:hypothetical protein